MPKKDIITRTKLRQRAKRIIKKLLAKEGFKEKKIIKFGTRYYIILGKKSGQPALFKSCIYPSSYDHLTNQKFSREINFLNFISSTDLQDLKKSVPAIYSSGTTRRAWYIREYISGQMQNINNGNIRFKKNFFTKKNADWIISFIKELHQIKEAGLPSKFKKNLYSPQTLNYLWQFIDPYQDKIDSFVGTEGTSRAIKKLFKKYSNLYKSAPKALAHQELYPPHFIKTEDGFKIIDWENIGWAPIMKDVATLWMRASASPEWQKYIFRKFKLFYIHYHHLDKLWQITILMQSTFNVIGYYFYRDKKDFSRLAQFSKKQIKNIINRGI